MPGSEGVGTQQCVPATRRRTDAPKDTGQDPDSIIETPNLDPNSIQQFVVRTGGRNHVRFTKPPLVGEVVRDDRSFGVLSMRLYSSSYDWEFVPVEGSTVRDCGQNSTMSSSDTRHWTP
jgi:hypothetical protein